MYPILGTSSPKVHDEVGFAATLFIVACRACIQVRRQPAWLSVDTMKLTAIAFAYTIMAFVLSTIDFVTRAPHAAWTCGAGFIFCTTHRVALAARPVAATIPLDHVASEQDIDVKSLLDNGSGVSLPLPDDIDETRMLRVRHLITKEAHCRAQAALEAYLTELHSRSAGGHLTAQKLEQYCRGDLEIQRSQFKARGARVALATLKETNGAAVWDSHYSTGSVGKDLCEMWGRQDVDGLAVLRVRSRFLLPIFKHMALLNEVDLWPQWIPFVWECKLLHFIEGGGGDYAQFIVLMRFVLPWPLMNREAIIFGYACEMLDESKIVINASTLSEDVTKWWGCDLPPPRSAVRMNMDFKIMVAPGDEKAESTLMDMVVKFDPKISWLPQSIINFIGKQIVNILIGNIRKIAKTFERGPYPARVEADERGFYKFVQFGVNQYLKGLLPEGDPLPRQASDVEDAVLAQHAP